MVPFMGWGLIFVLVVADHEREKTLNKVVIGAVVVVVSCEAVRYIEGEVDRHERVETQRHHAEPHGNRHLQPMWPHREPTPRAGH